MATKRRTSPRSPRRYDWRPDLPDQRDQLFGAMVKPPKRLPPSVDLRAACPPIVNQGQVGSCTGNALAGMLGFLQLKEMREAGGPDPEVFDPNEFCPFSRLFIYYNERSIEGHVDQDAGASLRDGVKSLAKWGCCQEASWKYSTGNVLKKPAAKAYTEAARHEITSYLSLLSMPELRQCLADGFPFAFGFTVYESFESPVVARSGIMPLPRAGESVLGGHAVLAVGYDDAKERFLVRNSWGEAWGLKGYFWMPYAYIEDRGLAQDFWTVRR